MPSSRTKAQTSGMEFREQMMEFVCRHPNVRSTVSSGCSGAWKALLVCVLLLPVRGQDIVYHFQGLA